MKLSSPRPRGQVLPNDDRFYRACRQQQDTFAVFVSSSTVLNCSLENLLEKILEKILEKLVKKLLDNALDNVLDNVLENLLIWGDVYGSTVIGCCLAILGVGVEVG